MTKRRAVRRLPPGAVHITVDLRHLRGGAAVEVIEADDGHFEQQHGEQRALKTQTVVHGAADAQQAGVFASAQADFARLAVEKAHLTEHFSGHDLADFHFAFGQLRHQAALPFEHEKQALANLADIGDDFAFFRRHEIAIVEKIMNFSASEDGGVHELTQKMGQGFAVFRGESQAFHGD